MVDDEYIPVEDVAAMLKVTIRQANRYGEGANPRVRTRKAGNRKLYHRGDVELLADELGVAFKTRPQQTQAELIPPGEMLDLVRNLQDRLAGSQERLIVASHRIGELEGQLQQRLLPEEAATLRQQLADVEAERDKLKEELERKNQPWWRRFRNS
jgi:hypothetical protein